MRRMQRVMTKVEPLIETSAVIRHQTQRMQWPYQVFPREVMASANECDYEILPADMVQELSDLAEIAAGSVSTEDAHKLIKQDQ